MLMRRENILIFVIMFNNHKKIKGVRFMVVCIYIYLDIYYNCMYIYYILNTFLELFKIAFMTPH